MRLTTATADPASPAAHLSSVEVSPEEVPDRLRKHLLIGDLPVIPDLVASAGSWLVDARDGARYLDCYTFFASAPLGINPPEITDDAGFMELLSDVAVNKPANSDLATTHLAEFVETFERVLGDPALPHLFFVEGGAPAVENALKCAFDWKSRRNEAAGRPRTLGTKVLHLTRAFHGRTGYTLSLTNTDPVKTDRYPVFGWPRIDVPAVRFPLADHLEEVTRAERHALAQAEAAFAAAPHDIAAFIAEPIQGEGGDNHLRREFLQAMQDLCHEYDALFIIDEVQTGVGLTGSPWAYQQFGLAPDIVAFGKKVQLGGIMAGRRVDEVPENVFAVPGRINSTWGGGLVDMVRSRRLMEVMERDNLLTRTAQTGPPFVEDLTAVAARHPDLVDNVRGRGLMCAFDARDDRVRTEIIRRMREEEHVLLLSCGERSVRFRPALTIAPEELTLAAGALDRVLARMD